MTELIDLTRYPLDRPGSAAWRALARRCHDEFHRTGILALPDFVPPASARSMAAEALARMDLMCRGRTVHNIYQHDADDPAYAADHPRNRKMVTECLCLPGDDIPRDAQLRSVYQWAPLATFVSAVVKGPVDDPPALYRFADPLGALTVNVCLRDHEIAWHFDQAKFVVILLLQGADAGGEYQVAPESKWLPDGTVDYELHRRVLDEREPSVRSHRFGRGTLIVHTGTHSLHRVARVRGETPRVSALLAYADLPDQHLSDAVRQTYYGRTRPREGS